MNKMNMKTCKHCNDRFDLDGHFKKQAGGKINECPDCVYELETETAVKYTAASTESSGSLEVEKHATAAARAAHMASIQVTDISH
tara:strand:- start:27 stop:281 length:255 start_codon:yes stop_codon:yes gene_type:complete